MSKYIDLQVDLLIYLFFLNEDLTYGYYLPKYCNYFKVETSTNLQIFV